MYHQNIRKKSLVSCKAKNSFRPPVSEISVPEPLECKYKELLQFALLSRENILPKKILM